MIKPDELAICKRRGHAFAAMRLEDGWAPCKWCGIWAREIRTLEEREDTPPEHEWNSRIALDWKIKKLNETMK